MESTITKDRNQMSVSDRAECIKDALDTVLLKIVSVDTGFKPNFLTAQKNVELNSLVVRFKREVNALVINDQSLNNEQLRDRLKQLEQQIGQQIIVPSIDTIKLEFRTNADVTSDFNVVKRDLIEAAELGFGFSM